MAIPQLSAIENMLAQMRAVADAASSSPTRTQPAAADTGGFAAALKSSLERVSTLQNDSAAQARSFQLGAPDVSLNDVMIDMQKASIAFQATVQVRNRLVAAYQEIASMPV
ncbi:flagellar hook-basal body complex protein FliE [Pusillimonas sp. SM2304]|uniref:flagellar hook-basal body complex protein FliE n=1 Tax=Pusillimonas sp. SM2304 TaxID=3073241 RepID=UPI0028758E31|nr:flagellar hook-basal body complex protein FliE [Pusillimonas sp. SM2304]MDS1141142.1 flagellar hook-basal body complex protein FliE [Pusillimonas sp. SM2304]